MKKLIASLLLSIGILFAPLPVYAEEFNSQIDCSGEAAESEFCKSKDNEENTLFGPDGVLTRVIVFLNIVVGFTAVIAIIFAGYRFINSNGDPQKVATARNTVTYGVIGLALAAVSQLIVVFIVTKV